MTGLMTNLFGTKITPLDKFYRTEKTISDQFSKTGVLIRSYLKSQNGLERETQKLNDFVSANANVQIAEDTVENKVFERRLRNRKWFTVVADALVSIPSIKLVMGETVGASLTTPVALTLGCIFSYMLLKLAIDYKNDDVTRNESNIASSFTRYWKQYSYLIPLALIPILSLFLIAEAPGNPANFIWLVFLVVAFFLNLKAASYSKQYIMMENTAMARKEKSKIEKSMEQFTKAIEGINDKMQSHRQRIEVTANALFRNWQAIPEGDRPKEITLSPKYIFVLNNQIYFRQVLPIPPLGVVLPNGPVAEFEMFWNDTGGITNRTNTPSVQEENQIPSGLESPVVDENQNTSEPEDVEEVEDAPSFGKVINDTNKYV
jgi:hypothetical protein